MNHIFSDIYMGRWVFYPLGDLVNDSINNNYVSLHYPLLIFIRFVPVEQTGLCERDPSRSSLKLQT